MIQPQESREAEMCVIGGCLRSASARDRAFSVISDVDFFHADLRTVFKVISILKLSGGSPDIITTHQKLKDLNLLEEVDSPKVLEDCVSKTPEDYDILLSLEQKQSCISLEKFLAIAFEKAYPPPAAYYSYPKVYCTFCESEIIDR